MKLDLDIGFGITVVYVATKSDLRYYQLFFEAGNP